MCFVPLGSSSVLPAFWPVLCGESPSVKPPVVVTTKQRVRFVEHVSLHMLRTGGNHFHPQLPTVVGAAISPQQLPLGGQSCGDVEGRGDLQSLNCLKSESAGVIFRWD